MEARVHDESGDLTAIWFNQDLIYSHMAIRQIGRLVNGLSDSHHPCQALADMLTITELMGRIKGKRLFKFAPGLLQLFVVIQRDDFVFEFIVKVFNVSLIVGFDKVLFSGFRPDRGCARAVHR